MVENIRPTSNVNSNWDVNTYANIDENVVEPNAGNGDTINWDKNDDGEKQEYNMGNTTYTAITKLVLWIYTRTLDDGGTVARMKIGATDSGDLSLPNDDSWHSKTWNGTWTQAEVNSLTVELEAPARIGGSKYGEFDVVYVEVTGTTAVRKNIIICKEENG